MVARHEHSGASGGIIPGDIARIWHAGILSFAKSSLKDGEGGPGSEDLPDHSIVCKETYMDEYE